MSKDIKLDLHEESEGKLKKAHVGLFALVGMYYAEICSGAFGIEEMIPEAGPGMSLVILVALALFWAFPISFICSEMGSARPDEGGVLVWIKEGMGEFWYGIALVCMTIWGLVANAVYIVLAVSYLGELIALPLVVAAILKVSLVIFFFLLNVKGVREMGLFSAILTLAIIVAFAAVAVVGLMNWNQNPMEPFIADPEVGMFASMGAGLNVGIWMYCGFEQISMMSGEIKDADRLIPKALKISIPIICLTYILPTLGGLVSIGRWDEWTTETGGVGYATVLIENGIPAAGTFFLVVAVIAQLAAYNVTMAAAARGVYMLAEDHFGPKWVAGVSKKYGTPFNALLLTTIVALILMPFDFAFLVTLEVFFVALVYALMTISAMILKRKIPAEEFTFKFPGGKVAHTICSIIILTICLMVTVVSGVDYFFGGLCAILILPILYVICKKAFKGSSFKEPGLYPLDPRTGLGYGDYTKVGYYFTGAGLYAIVAKFFLVWYEGGIEAGSAYYLEEYGSGIFSNMELMLNLILIIGVIAIVVGCIVLAYGKKLDRGNPPKKA